MPRQHPRSTLGALGVLALAVVALGSMPAPASAETCSATETDAACGTGAVGDTPPLTDAASARADDDGVGSSSNATNGVTGSRPGAGSSSSRDEDAPGASVAASQSTESSTGAASGSSTGVGDPATGHAEAGTFTETDGTSSVYRVAVVPADTPVDTPPGSVREGTADATASGDRAGAAASESESSRARSDAAGSDAHAASAAVDRSDARARARGDGATAGAAATNGSSAKATATGTGSTARAVAIDRDRASARALWGGTADVSPTSAHCRGGIAYGYELRSPSVCGSVGPVGLGFSGRSGTDIGLGGSDLTGIGQPDHPGRRDSGHTRDGDDDHQGKHRT